MRSNIRGFTLVERIIVLLIIEVLAMAGMPAFGTWFAKGREDSIVPCLFRGA